MLGECCYKCLLLVYMSTTTLVCPSVSYWSQMNPSLYSISFTGCAHQAKRCELCFSTSHPTKVCTLLADPEPDLPSRIKTVEAAVVLLAAHQQGESKLVCTSKPTPKICHLYNVNRCCYTQCRFCPVCSGCRDSHPLIYSPNVGTKASGPISPAWGANCKELATTVEVVVVTKISNQRTTLQTTCRFYIVLL